MTSIEVHALAVRIGVRGGVAVNDPDDPAFHDRRVGVAVNLQPGCGALHQLPRRPVIDDLGLRVDAVGEQDVDVGELGGVEQPIPQVADLDPAFAGVGVGLRVAAFAAARRIQLDRWRTSRCADDGVLVRPLAVQFPEVDARLVLLDQTGRRNVLGDPLRLTAGLPPVAVRRDKAVAVGVDGLPVVPVVLDTAQVHLPDSHHRIGFPAGDGVAVHIEDLGERVVAPDLLQLLERRTDRRSGRSDGFLATLRRRPAADLRWPSSSPSSR